jgi:hypothetical protein
MPAPITQDTFSFALVLLCLAVGDIAYVRKQGGIIARTAYYSGWRPPVRKSLRVACPEIAALIKEMWLADFRARPAMKDVVVRLEACVIAEDAAKGLASTALPIAGPPQQQARLQQSEKPPQQQVSPAAQTLTRFANTTLTEIEHVESQPIDSKIGTLLRLLNLHENVLRKVREQHLQGCLNNFQHGP